MTFNINSRHLVSLLILILAFTLVACERPLNEEDASQTEVPSDADESELGPDGETPIMVPTREVVLPAPDKTPPDDQQADATVPGDETAAEPPTGETEALDSGQSTEEVNQADPNEAAGQPAGEQIHTVQAGDNLYRIGLQYGCTIAELATYNALANPDYLDVGQEIRIPANCTGQ